MNDKIRRRLERACRVLPVAGIMVVFGLGLWWRHGYYSHELFVDNLEWNAYCRPNSQYTSQDWCAVRPDLLSELWLPSLVDALAITMATAAIVILFAGSMYAAFTAPITADQRTQRNRERNGWEGYERPTTASIASLSTSVLLISIASLLLIIMTITQ